jgi:hypothetical protein
MLRTVEAVISPDGDVRLLEDVRLPAPRRALVTILDEESPNGDALLSAEAALASEAALAVDWLREEEDEVWAHLQGVAPQGQAALQERP